MAATRVIKSKAAAFFLLLLLVTGAHGDEGKGNIHILIENLRNSEGTVRISLYPSKEGFPFNPRKARFQRVASIAEGRAEVIFKAIPPGDYAAGALHDENGNGKLDFKWGLFPQEGLGVSNNPEPGLAPPSFEDSKVTLKSGSIELKIKIRY